MRKRWKIVSQWLHHRARARALNDELAASDARSRLDQLDRPGAIADDDWTEQRLLRLLDMMIRDDSSRAG